VDGACLSTATAMSHLHVSNQVSAHMVAQGAYLVSREHTCRADSARGAKAIRAAKQTSPGRILMLPVLMK